MSLDQLHLLPPEQQDAILNGPALTPPSLNIIPNFENPPNGNPVAFTTITICLSVSTIIAILRAYSRVFLLRQVTREDCEADSPLTGSFQLGLTCC